MFRCFLNEKKSRIKVEEIMKTIKNKIITFLSLSTFLVAQYLEFGLSYPLVEVLPKYKEISNSKINMLYGVGVSLDLFYKKKQDFFLLTGLDISSYQNFSSGNSSFFQVSANILANISFKDRYFLGAGMSFLRHAFLPEKEVDQVALTTDVGSFFNENIYAVLKYHLFLKENEMKHFNVLKLSIGYKL
jgi:hypothetical protein